MKQATNSRNPFANTLKRSRDDIIEGERERGGLGGASKPGGQRGQRRNPENAAAKFPQAWNSLESFQPDTGYV